MRIAIFLSLLLSLQPSAFAECGWQGDWYVCPSEKGVLKVSRFQPVSVSEFRYWVTNVFHDVPTKYSPARDYSWTRYFHVNCASRTFQTLQTSFEGEWLLDRIELRSQEESEKGKVEYFAPSSPPEQYCLIYKRAQEAKPTTP